MGAASSVVKYEDIGGYLVTIVKAGSPGAKAGLQEKVDFIKAMNGLDLISIEEQKIVDLVEASKDKPIELQVYSSSTGETRTVHVTPSNDWAGEAGDGLLGIKIRLSLYENCTDELGELVQINPAKSVEADKDNPRTALPSFDVGDVPKEGEGEGVVPGTIADNNSCAQELPLNHIDSDLKLEQKVDQKVLEPPQAEAVLVHAKSEVLRYEADVAVSAKAEVVAPSEQLEPANQTESPRAPVVEAQ